MRRLAIPRRNTPDLVQGSRNFTDWSAHRFAPSLSFAHAAVSVSSILLANSGGEKTSSFDKLAMSHDHMIAGQHMSDQIEIGGLQKRIDGRRCVVLPGGPRTDLGELRRQCGRRAPKE